MKIRLILLVSFLILPFFLFSQVKKSSNVYKLHNGNYYRVGKVVRENDWKFTTYVYKNKNGSDILVGKAYDGKAFLKNSNGKYKEAITIQRDGKTTKLYFFKNGNLIGKGSWMNEKIYKKTGYNFWDGYTYDLVGKIDGGGENKSLGAALLLIYN
ncbi:MAG: hypothetical protein HWE24_17610 [Oceanospirillaceae bacterium]|nr:hypothetical protein [Oceanospirillaceae bacterium]